MKSDIGEILKNSQWEDEQYEEIVNKYPDMWIAVSNKAVIAADKVLENVQKKVKKIVKDSPVFFDFIESGAHIYHDKS